MFYLYLYGVMVLWCCGVSCWGACGVPVVIGLLSRRR